MFSTLKFISVITGILLFCGSIMLMLVAVKKIMPSSSEKSCYLAIKELELPGKVTSIARDGEKWLFVTQTPGEQILVVVDPCKPKLSHNIILLKR